MASLFGGDAQVNISTAGSSSDTNFAPTFNVGSGRFNSTSGLTDYEQTTHNVDQKASSELSASAVIPVNSKTGNNSASNLSKIKQNEEKQPTKSYKVDSSPGTNFVPGGVPQFSNIDSNQIIKYGAIAGGALLIYLLIKRK